MSARHRELVDDALLAELPASRRAHCRAVLVELADLADDAGRAFPTVATLADLSHLRERTVDQALTLLADCGWLTRDSRPGRPTIYQLTDVDPASTRVPAPCTASGARPEQRRLHFSDAPSEASTRPGGRR